MSIQDRLFEYFSVNGVTVTLLDAVIARKVGQLWQGIYAYAFYGRPRMRQGLRAVEEYRQIQCRRYYLIPLNFKVAGVPSRSRNCNALAPCLCEGALLPFGEFADPGIVITPDDMDWTMVHTHEDHGLRGPFFVRHEWTNCDPHKT